MVKNANSCVPSKDSDTFNFYFLLYSIILVYREGFMVLFCFCISERKLYCALKWEQSIWNKPLWLEKWEITVVLKEGKSLKYNKNYYCFVDLDKVIGMSCVYTHARAVHKNQAETRWTFSEVICHLRENTESSNTQMWYSCPQGHLALSPGGKEASTSLLWWNHSQGLQLILCSPSLWVLYTEKMPN